MKANRAFEPIVSRGGIEPAFLASPARPQEFIAAWEVLDGVR